MTEWLNLGQLTEVPYLAAFIIFAIALFKYFQRWSDIKDKAHLDAITKNAQLHIDRMEKSEKVWREFLTNQRDDFLNSIADITCALTEVKRKQEDHTIAIEAMQGKQDEHDKKLDIALAVLEATKK